MKVLFEVNVLFGHMWNKVFGGFVWRKSALVGLCGVLLMGVGCIGTAPPLSGVPGVGQSDGTQKQQEPGAQKPKVLPFCLPVAQRLEAMQLQTVRDTGDTGCQLTSFSITGNGVVASRIVYEDRGETVEARRYSKTKQLTGRDLWRRDHLGRLVAFRNYTVSGAKEELRSYRNQTLDAAGRVLSDTNGYIYQGKDTQTIQRQEWDGDRLVKREQISTNGSRYEWRWSYDGAGRVVSASQLQKPLNGQPQQVFAMTWTYDREGRPTALVHSYDGVEQARQTWEWSGTGLLKKRVLTSIPAAKVHANLMIWPKQDGSCRKLPMHWGYGYDDNAYTPGWTTGKPVSQILPALKELPDNGSFIGHYGYYGYYGYGYYGYYTYYGYYGYYGGDVAQGQLAPPYTHFGSRPPHGLMNNRTYASLLVIDYDDKGRMVQETAKQGSADNKTDPHQSLWSRKRVWGGELLRQDALTLYSEGEASYERLLRFSYDQAGRLQRRTLLQGELRIEEQQWQYNANGQLIGHENTILTQEAMSKLQQWEQGTRTEPSPTDLPTDKVRFQLVWDGAERLRSESLQWESQKSTHQRTYEYSAQGKVSTIVYGNADRLNKQIIAQNQDGQITRQEYDNDNDGKPESSQVSTYNAQGLLTEQKVTSTNTKNNATSTNSTNYEYVCQ